MMISGGAEAIITEGSVVSSNVARMVRSIWRYGFCIVSISRSIRHQIHCLFWSQSGGGMFIFGAKLTIDKRSKIMGNKVHLRVSIEYVPMLYHAPCTHFLGLLPGKQVQYTVSWISHPH